MSGDDCADKQSALSALTHTHTHGEVQSQHLMGKAAGHLRMENLNTSSGPNVIR